MTIDDLLTRLRVAQSRFGGDRQIVIYNDGDFIVEDAWFDRSSEVFAIQVLPKPDAKSEPPEPRYPDVDGLCGARTPWAVTCREHGLIYLAESEYTQQLSRPDLFWVCPVCRKFASWEEDNYKEMTDGGLDR